MCLGQSTVQLLDHGVTSAVVTTTGSSVRTAEANQTMEQVEATEAAGIQAEERENGQGANQ